MDSDKLAQRAVELKESGKFNCAQAVLEALKGECSLSSDVLYSIGSGLGLGMGNMEGVCGALVAACIIAGLKSGGQNAMALSREIQSEFKSLSGAVLCKDLKGISTGKPLTPCTECVRNAATAYCKILHDN